ncbi:ricin-type beta-trefoil lectin domain protein [Nonomuraea sp. PA05]|uniref:RICIN domain-containing protein n=1 Tax=Nonomuraea sp. PA05 TaxID=2604466 RepID=UPI0011D7AAC4|nr:RICIN domain-containing protein [Nonomuraea sp. PA05]TYB64833.1 ricin-type beta-trefoil lectin domain protein [Nonomuraea sp. PA05]
MSIKRGLAVLTVAVASAGLITASTTAAQAQNYFKIVSFASGMCLQPDPSAPAGSDAQIFQAPCDGSAGQNWLPLQESSSASTYRFLNQRTGWCLEAREGAVNLGRVDQWPCNTISNEKWVWSGSFNNTTPKQIRSAVSGTRTHCIDVPGGSPSVPLYVFRCNGSAAQQFFIRS